MKTARIASVLLVSLFTLAASAQGTSKCEAALKPFEDAVGTLNYNDAAALMPDLRKKCPDFSEKLYQYGQKVLEYKIETAATPADKQLYVDDLAALYTEYARYFPKGDGVVKKALLQKEHSLAKDEEVFKSLDLALVSHKDAFTDYNAIETYYNLMLKQYEEGKKGFTQEQFIEKYGAIAAQIAYAKSKIAADRDALLKKQETEKLTAAESRLVSDAGNNIKALDAVGENMALQSSRHFTCDKLEAYYEKNYEAHKADLPWLEGLTTGMYNNKCYNSAVLYKAGQAVHTAKPTAQTAYMMGSIEMKKHNQKQAIVYFEQSAALEENTAKKADLYYDIASIFRNSDKAKAKEFAMKAIGTNAKFGKPYILLAEMYSTGGRECGLSEFDRKALSWLAIETVKKAEVAEPRYKTTVASLVKNFEKNLPTKEEAKAAKRKKGDVITYGCWISQTVTVPNL
ncbi:hypothetical protein OGH69_06955 [Flavobacterium sp. MFBS3-15]|uniref:hypothetical protein n=1 Tax=Flavobacterium sp. MFBS3-15 TaxID=2989816 RepID=UPI0022366CF1|nr:hypothetical protein [Flavobacterium sp. MFBS3-15]MCW4468693.1 hypothetical protein [Flavobacterium sp. MFBS3-15]